MAQFNKAFAITMKNEGGYANNPNDHGGETWRGIARKFWSLWHGWTIVDQIKATMAPGAKVSVLNTALAANGNLEELVLSFYKTNFWDTEQLDLFNDQAIANQLFDIAVNMGTKTASTLLQEAANTLTENKLIVDGIIGKNSIATVNALGAEQLYNALCKFRKEKYEHIIANNPSQAVFRNSWFSRITPYNNLA